MRHDLGRREPLPPVPREEKRRTQVQQIGRRLAPLGCQLRAPLSRGGAGPRLVHRVARETAVTPRSGGALSLVDDATDAVSRMGPWVGLLWITALPARLLLALLCVRLIELGSESPGYGHYLSRLSYAALGAWLVSLWGRQAFVRACRHALESERPLAGSVWRVPLRELAGHLSAALVIELLFWMLLLTFVAPVALFLAAGLAAVASPRAGPGIWKPLRAIAESSGSLFLLLRLLFVFALALLVAAINLHFLFGAGLWLAGGVAGVDRSTWGAVLSVHNPLYVVLILTGAGLLLEPFWLAALTAHVERVRARESGDDLRLWFAELRAKA